MRDVKKFDMTDRERILTTISARIGPFCPRHDTTPPSHLTGVHWWLGPARIGDLVRSSTTGIHPFTWGYLDSLLNDGRYVMRSLTGPETCVMSNDGYYVLRGIREWELLWGPQRAFFRKVRAAIWKHGDFLWRFSDISFPSAREARIEIRPHSWILKHPGREVTCSFTMSFTSKTTVKAIMTEMMLKLPANQEAWNALQEVA